MTPEQHNVSHITSFVLDDGSFLSMFSASYYKYSFAHKMSAVLVIVSLNDIIYLSINIILHQKCDYSGIFLAAFLTPVLLVLVEMLITYMLQTYML